MTTTLLLCTIGMSICLILGKKCLKPIRGIKENMSKKLLVLLCAGLLLGTQQVKPVSQGGAVVGAGVIGAAVGTITNMATDNVSLSVGSGIVSGLFTYLLWYDSTPKVTLSRVKTRLNRVEVELQNLETNSLVQVLKTTNIHDHHSLKKDIQQYYGNYSSDYYPLVSATNELAKLKGELAQMGKLLDSAERDLTQVCTEDQTLLALSAQYREGICLYRERAFLLKSLLTDITNVVVNHPEFKHQALDFNYLESVKGAERRVAKLENKEFLKKLATVGNNDPVRLRQAISAYCRWGSYALPQAYDKLQDILNDVVSELERCSRLEKQIYEEGRIGVPLSQRCAACCARLRTLQDKIPPYQHGIASLPEFMAQRVSQEAKKQADETRREAKEQADMLRNQARCQAEEARRDARKQAEEHNDELRKLRDEVSSLKKKLKKQRKR